MNGPNTTPRIVLKVLKTFKFQEFFKKKSVGGTNPNLIVKIVKNVTYY